MWPFLWLPLVYSVIVMGIKLRQIQVVKKMTVWVWLAQTYSKSSDKPFRLLMWAQCAALYVDCDPCFLGGHFVLWLACRFQEFQ